MLPAPEEILLGPVAMTLGRGLVAVPLLRIPCIGIECFRGEYLAPQAFRPIKDA